MAILTEPAPAKVNFALDILGKREDGYHEMRMINHEIRLADALTFSESDQIELFCDDPEVPTGEENLIFRTVIRVKKEFGIHMGIRIDLKKNIPMQAGLGGGSADAAATLRGLNQIWQLGMTEEEMRAFGAEIGADVPYCISGGTALVEGFGERITPLKPLPGLNVLVIKPAIPISTPLAFQLADRTKALKHFDIEGLIEAMGREDWEALSHLAGNSFEGPVFQRWPQIERIKEKCRARGALHTTMSGSGSTVVAYFPDLDSARKAGSAFKNEPVVVTLSEVWQKRRKDGIKHNGQSEGKITFG